MLNPNSLSEYVGQNQLKKNLQIVLENSRRTGKIADHMLFTGPAGLGKTSLAGVVAKELNRPFIKLMGPHIKDLDPFKPLIEASSAGTILFIDEIHGLPLKVEESLYELMDDFSFKGQRMCSFTLVGATTLEGLVSKPLRSRFAIVERLDPYPVADLALLLKHSATSMKLVVNDTVLEEIAGRSRGTPRIAKQLLKRISYYGNSITLESARQALDSIGIDELGLERLDRVILETMRRNFGGGPVGIQSLANVVGEDVTTINSRETFMVSIGLIDRTGRGRTLTEKAGKYLGL